MLAHCAYFFSIRISILYIFFPELKTIDTCGNPTMTMTRIMSLASAYGLLINLLPTNFSGNEIGKTADAASISKVSCQNHPPIITASKTGTYIHKSEQKKNFILGSLDLTEPSPIVLLYLQDQEARKALQMQ